MSRVLVTGATGTVGSALVAELRRRDVAVRPFVRDAGRAAAALGADLEPAVGDLADPASVRRALGGVDAVFLACGNVPGQARHETRVIDLAAQTGVRRLVKLSALGAEPGSPVPFWDAHGRVEAHLAGSGVPAIVLRPAYFLTNLLTAAEPVAAAGRLPAPAGDARIAMVDPRDVAAVAAIALTQDGHEGRTYVLTGPVAVTHHEVATALSQAAGRHVEYVDVPAAAAHEGMLAAGLPPVVADGLAGLYAALRAGSHAAPTGTVQAVTGAAPRDLAAWAREHARAFGAGALV